MRVAIIYKTHAFPPTDVIFRPIMGDGFCESFNRERIKFDFIPDRTGWQTTHNILSAAKRVGMEGPVAQYLVGARQNTELLLPGRISVQSLEALISQNLEELSGFTRPPFAPTTRRAISKCWNAQ